ncbi:MAG: alkaline phosphatase [Planctomycetes bacterium]|nr:alkaline phosphatase [Planctomycetota bacterium]
MRHTWGERRPWLAGIAVIFGAVLLLAAGLVCSGKPATSEDPKKAPAARRKEPPRPGGPKRGLVKNFILLISDGCGYNHVDAASLYQQGRTGAQTYEHFPVRVGMSTYPASGEYDPLKAWADFDYVKSGATDSAAAATAMSTGVKTYSGGIGVDIERKPLTHFLEMAEALGKATGVVTSVPLSHATPAGFVAHNESRSNYEAIANEMIYTSAVDVIMGCGAPDFDNSGKPAIGNTMHYVGGAAAWADMQDGAVMGADADGDHEPDEWTVIRSREQFQALADARGRHQLPSRVLGIPLVFETLQQGRSGDSRAAPFVVPLLQSVPTLAEMAEAALQVLSKDRDGFCLMIEGGAVDWASHSNQSGRMIEEQIDFNQAVEAVVAWVHRNSNWGETIMVVTSDHECGYLTGPGSDPAWNPLVNHGKNVQPGLEWHRTGHTNALVPLYARGFAATLFRWAATRVDPVRGRYLDNTAAGTLAFALLGVTNPNR